MTIHTSRVDLVVFDSLELFLLEVYDVNANAIKHEGLLTQIVSTVLPTQTRDKDTIFECDTTLDLYCTRQTG